MKYIDKFSSLIRDEETVVWIGNVNKKAYLKKSLLQIFFIGLFPLFIPFMLLLLTLFLPITLLLINKSANNTFLCITNKQIIKRNGIIRDNYVSIPMSIIGEISLDTSIFDSKTPFLSSSIDIKAKNQSYLQGSTSSRITVSNLNLADEAFKIISKYSDSNNLM